MLINQEVSHPILSKSVTGVSHAFMAQRLYPLVNMGLVEHNDAAKTDFFFLKNVCIR